jgi:hypothetical protein
MHMQTCIHTSINIYTHAYIQKFSFPCFLLSSIRFRRILKNAGKVALIRTRVRIYAPKSVLKFILNLAFQTHTPCIMHHAFLAVQEMLSWISEPMSVSFRYLQSCNSVSCKFTRLCVCMYVCMCVYEVQCTYVCCLTGDCCNALQIISVEPLRMNFEKLVKNLKK